MLFSRSGHPIDCVKCSHGCRKFNVYALDSAGRVDGGARLWRSHLKISVRLIQEDGAVELTGSGVSSFLFPSCWVVGMVDYGSMAEWRVCRVRRSVADVRVFFFLREGRSRRAWKSLVFFFLQSDQGGPW